MQPHKNEQGERNRRREEHTDIRPRLAQLPDCPEHLRQREPRHTVKELH